MNEVLATSRYDRLTGRRVDIREIIREWLQDALYRLFSRLNINIGTPEFRYNLDVISTTFVIIGIILVIVASIVLYRTFRKRKQVKYHDISDIFEELAKKNYTVSELIDLSQNADNRRLAIRYRYIAVLLSLNEKQIIEITPSATNGLILHQIKAAAPTFLPPFECTADVFHRAWFGYKNIDDGLYNNFTNAVDYIINGDAIA